MQFAMYNGFTELVTQKGIEHAAAYAAEIGFTSVEFLEILAGNGALRIPDVKTAAKIRRGLEAQGLYVACYSAYANVWNETSEQDFRKGLEIAAELGSSYFHHTLLPWLTLLPECPSFEEGIKIAVEAASRAADYAKGLGLTCIYEDQGQYINGVEGFGKFYWELKKNCSNVGVCADLGNIYFVDERPQAFLEAFKTEIRHVHVKDYLQKRNAVSPGEGWLPSRNDLWLHDADVGEGIIDFKACVETIKNTGYTGPWSLEISVREPFAERAKRAMEYLRQF